MTAHPAERVTGLLKWPAVVWFWVPLAATWFMMGLEGPYIAAIVARLPETAPNLAAFGVATALAWLIESPIMMLLSASAALVRDRASYLALRRFALILNVAVTAGMLVLAIPPVFRFVAERLIGLSPELSRLAHLATVIMVLWPAAIGYRRFYQGILVRNRLTRRVAYGTVVRLVAMSITAGALALTVSIPGAAIGAFALLAGVICEAFAIRMMSAGLVRSLRASEEVAQGTLLDLPSIARFYFPLALTSMLSMSIGPMVTFGLGRGLAPLESLAVWPVVQSMVFLFRSGGIAFQEVGIALSGPDREHEPELRRIGLWLGAGATLSLAAFAFTPLEAVWLKNVSGLTDHLASFALLPVQVFVLLPLLEYVLSMQRSRWILEHRTAVITWATALEASVLALSLFLLVGVGQMVGAVAGAIAFMIGRTSGSVLLWVVARRR